MRRRTPTADRLASRTRCNPDSGCIEWVGAGNGKGYGMLWDGSRARLAHRIAYEIANGQIPDGMCILHRCDNRSCVNPEHLFLGTISDNNRDMTEKGRNYNSSKTHCKYGHEFTGENTYRPRRGGRGCLTCSRERRTKRYYANRDAELRGKAEYLAMNREAINRARRERSIARRAARASAERK